MENLITYGGASGAVLLLIGVVYNNISCRIGGKVGKDVCDTVRDNTDKTLNLLQGDMSALKQQFDSKSKEVVDSVNDAVREMRRYSNNK